MDIATVAGLIIAFGSLGVSTIVEGGNLGSLVNVSAAIIVFGGSIGATMVSLPLSYTLRVPIALKQALFVRHHEPVEVIRILVGLARVARRDGVLALENELANVQDPFIRRGIQLVVDGTDSETTRRVLETEMEAQRARHQAAAKFFTTIGGLAPTLGVTGTVMGLVHMLGRLSEPGTMGPAIAAAFIATLYGVASANLLFLPLAAKLRVRSEEEGFVRALIAEGIQAIQAGDSPILLVERLKAFVAPAARGAVDEGVSSRGGEASGLAGAET